MIRIANDSIKNFLDIVFAVIVSLNLDPFFSIQQFLLFFFGVHKIFYFKHSFENGDKFLIPDSTVRLVVGQNPRKKCKNSENLTEVSQDSKNC